MNRQGLLSPYAVATARFCTDIPYGPTRLGSRPPDLVQSAPGNRKPRCGTALRARYTMSGTDLRVLAYRSVGALPVRVRSQPRTG
eukprot:519710-Rhodomonas_salina.1